MNVDGVNALSDGTHAVAVNNAGQFNVNSSTSVGGQTVGTISGAGTTSVSNAGTVLNAPQVNQAAININAGAELHLTNSSNAFSNTSALNIAGSLGAWTGLLNVDQTGIIINGAIDATIRNQIIQGRNGGNWSGTGGITSTAAQNNNAQFAVGYVDTGSGVKVADTVIGDTNLDGKVNTSDLNTLITNFGSGTTSGPG